MQKISSRCIYCARRSFRGYLGFFSRDLHSTNRSLIESSDPEPTSSSVWKGVKRFYNSVDIRKAANVNDIELYEVLIQGRVLKTNAMNDLLIPSKEIALIIAGEFAAQREVISPASTPVYNLTCTAIDSYSLEDLDAAEDFEAEVRASRLAGFDQALSAKGYSEEQRNEFISAQSGLSASSLAGPGHASIVTGRNSSGAMTSGGSSGTVKLRDLMLDYLETDTLCYRVDLDMADPSERLLRKKQEKYYEPLMKWYEDTFQTTLGRAVGFNELHHTEDAYNSVEYVVDKADPFLKAALQLVVGNVKSTIITMAFVHGHITVQEAFDAARVEEEWQISENGFVEDGHDTARAHLTSILSAANILLSFLPNARPTPPTTIEDRKSYKQIRDLHVNERRDRENKLTEKKRKLFNEWNEKLAKSS
jgi:chaperone required for assembly of F1-ATPase